MKVSRVENEAWPKDTYEIEHNDVILYVIPVVDGLEVDTVHKFFVDYTDNEQFEITFYEFPEPKIE